MNIRINKDLEEQFRNEVAKRLGMKQGNLAKAVSEAFQLWISWERMSTKTRESMMKVARAAMVEYLESATVQEKEAMIDFFGSEQR